MYKFCIATVECLEKDYSKEPNEEMTAMIMAQKASGEFPMMLV
jgi:hypothetical protein